MSGSLLPSSSPPMPVAWQTDEHRFQTLVHANADGILVVSQAGDILYANPAAEVLLGRTQTELLGRAFGIPLHPSMTTEIEIPRLGQQSLCAEMRTLPTEWGTAQARVAVLRDVTEQRRSRLAFSFLNEVGRVLAGELDPAATVTNVLRLAVPELADWCLLDVLEDNRVLRRAVYADFETGTAQPLRSLCGSFPCTPGLAEQLAEFVQQRAGRWFNDPPPTSRTALALSPTQATTLRILNSHALMLVPLLARGKAVGMLTLARTQSGMFYDGQDLTLAEDFAERAALALDNAQLYYGSQVAIRQRDDFLALLAHELRNPLTAILNSAQLWQRQTAAPVQPSPGAAKHPVNGAPPTASAPVHVGPFANVGPLVNPAAMIEQQSVHMARLLDDLLDLARVTRGKLELRREKLDVRELVKRVANVVQSQLAARRQSLTLELESHSAWVDGDPERLEQVLSNLLTNASKFTPTGGAICIRLWVVAGQVCVSVQDNGRGLPPAELERVFEPFVQLDRTLDRSRGGLGLGLTLARDLLTLHGGTLTAHSAGVGLGSCFTLSLPQIAAPAPVAALPPPLPSGPQLRIVLVEDSPQIRAVFSELLRFCGHTVELAIDGEHGLQRIQELLPDVALIDIDMPKMNGYQVASALRANRQCDTVRLIAVSGYGQPDDSQRALTSGFDAHLTKPVRLEELQRLLREIAL